jgi:hypothetical protein
VEARFFMAHPTFNPKKQRTRDHVIADLSINHLERFILEEGYTPERWFHDYGYDLLMTTHDEAGYVETGQVYFQVKATDGVVATPKGYACTVDVRDYNLWISERMPVFLILHDARNRRAYWLDVQSYFQDDSSRRPRKEARTARVHIPASQVVSRRDEVHALPQVAGLRDILTAGR